LLKRHGPQISIGATESGIGNPPPKYADEVDLFGEAGAGKIKVEPCETDKSSSVPDVKVIFDSAVLTVAPWVSVSTETVNSSPRRYCLTMGVRYKDAA